MDREVDLRAVRTGGTGDAEHMLGLDVAFAPNARDTVSLGRETDVRVGNPLHAHRPSPFSIDHGEYGEPPLSLPQYLHDPLPTAPAHETILC